MVGSSGRRMSKPFLPIKLAQSMWICYCGMKRKKSGSSYENFVSHVRNAHPDFKQLMCSEPYCKKRRVHRAFRNRKETVLCGWVCLIVLCLLPFSTVGNVEVREKVKKKPIFVSKVMSYLPRLTEVVDKKI